MRPLYQPQVANRSRRPDQNVRKNLHATQFRRKPIDINALPNSSFQVGQESPAGTTRNTELKPSDLARVAGRHHGAAESGNVPYQAGSLKDINELHRPRAYYSQRPMEVKRRPKYYGLP